MRQDVTRRRPMSRLSDRAKRAVALGGNEAIRLHRDVVEPGDVLVGLLCCGDITVARVLGGVGIEVDSARQMVDALTAAGDVHGEITAVAPSSSTRAVIDRAATEADRMGNETVEPKHVLLALIQEQGTVARVLESSGTSADAIRGNLLADS